MVKFTDVLEEPAASSFRVEYPEYKKQWVSLKCQKISIRLHRIMSQKTAFNKIMLIMDSRHY
jgi:hypothetical protein